MGERAVVCAGAARVGGEHVRYRDRHDQLTQREAGGGEAEGFEQAEQQLIEHATRGDQHAARQVIEGASSESDDRRANGGGEADHEYSSEHEDER